VGSAGSVERVAVPPGVQADQVKGDCGEDVFEVGLGQASVAGMSQTGDGDGLADGALDTGASLPAGSRTLVLSPAGSSSQRNSPRSRQTRLCARGSGSSRPGSC
jgi:hypothetical protein